ncbi:NAD(P)-binding protein [Rhizodiscina lignyota]|uniref:NAD(P)-binding protein n=1 Tax=Rhizodiscina lignyota TaxID=1504668 RepID=A0A9P4ICI5_9PEZI|nr:NAD(P)-binding protein [Rhizodiscina lignyota]
MSKTVLVTGGSGLLGREVLKAFERAGWKAVGTALTRTNPPSIVKLDLEDEDEIEKILEDVKPDVVVHSAANRFPDFCESSPPSAFAINSTATATLASQTFRRSIFLLYISTDYVFSGRPGEAPYYPSSPTHPPNVYGQTKRDGEIGVLRNTGGPADGNADASGQDGWDDGPAVLGAVLRVPLLYGSADKEKGESESAVHPLVTSVYKAQYIKADDGDAKIKMDDYAIRYPTCTEDVGRVCVDVSTLYLGERDTEADKRKFKQLPRILQFSSEQKYTKYEMCEALAEILGLPVDGLQRWDPSKEDEGKSEGDSQTARPYDCHLDTGALKELGINVNCLDFVAWWRRELRAFRH